jgi:hypothetical protein
MSRYGRDCLMASCFASILLQSSAVPHAQAPLSDFSTLAYTVGVPDRKFVVLEPIPLTLRVENRTGRPVTGHTLIDFASRRTTLVVQPEGSGAYEFKNLSLGMGGLVDPTPTIVQPGETHAVDELLTLGLDKAFPKPGRYSIQFVLHNGKDGLRSNVVLIELRAPGGLEQAAQQHMESTGAAGRFFAGPVDDHFETRLVEVAANFGETPYGDYANLFLGERSLGRRDYERARAHLSRVATKADFPLRQRAAMLLSEVQGK